MRLENWKNTRPLQIAGGGEGRKMKSTVRTGVQVEAAGGMLNPRGMPGPQLLPTVPGTIVRVWIETAEGYSIGVSPSQIRGEGGVGETEERKWKEKMIRVAVGYGL